MTWYYTFACVSLLLNVFLIWYLVKVLRKLIFISDHLSDLFLTTKAFQLFVREMYTMERYHGEPMIQELIFRLKDIHTEIENFRDIFEYTLDEELEEELNAAEEEDPEQKPLLHESS